MKFWLMHSVVHWFAANANLLAILVTAGVVVVFLYLSVTSFWRARRR